VNLSLAAAALEWGVSKRTAYRLAEANRVRVVRFDGRITIPAEEVERVRLEGPGPAPVPGPPSSPSSPPSRPSRAGAGLTYRVTLRPLPQGDGPPALVRLRKALKVLLRSFRLRAVRVEELP
jgi:hypothetical protein